MELKYCLINRSILELYGEDCSTFLQGLITQNINLLNNINSIYTLLLTNNGRFLLDFFIIKNNNSLLIDINTDYLDQIIEIIQYYKLRAKVKFKINNQLKIYTIFNSVYSTPLKPTNENNTVNINNNIIIIDPRLDNLGLRILTNNTSFIKDNTTIEYIKNLFYGSNIKSIKKVDSLEYTNIRYKYNVPEVTELIQKKSIPLECNFEELNAISFNKGCYIGQEFTNSSKRVMVTKKRLITMEIKNYSTNINYNYLKLNYITNNKEEKVGKILSIHNKNIMALLKIDALTETNNIFVSNNIELIPCLPEWLIQVFKKY